MADLSRSDIEYLSRLARLELTGEEMDRYATQLTQVVHFVEQLNEIDTEQVNAELGVTGLTNVLADDVPRDEELLDREKALGAAPRRDADFIEVRAVLGGEQGAA